MAIADWRRVAGEKLRIRQLYPPQSAFAIDEFPSLPRTAGFENAVANLEAPGEGRELVGFDGHFSSKAARLLRLLWSAESQKWGMLHSARMPATGS